MSNVDAMEFVNKVTEPSSNTKEYTLVHENGYELTVQLTQVDRKKLLDELHKLPDEMMEMLQEAEDEDEATEMAEEKNMLSGVNGDTIEAFENICVLSMTHDELTVHHFEDMVGELGFEVLFEMGARAIEHSFENQGSIKDFREVDSDKSS